MKTFEKFCETCGTKFTETRHGYPTKPTVRKTCCRQCSYLRLDMRQRKYGRIHSKVPPSRAYWVRTGEKDLQPVRDRQCVRASRRRQNRIAAVRKIILKPISEPRLKFVRIDWA